MSELLIELFSEEIPANLQESSVKTFELMMLNNFKEELQLLHSICVNNTL